MEALFSDVLNMSLTASVIIVLVLAVRVLLRKAPKVYSYALWAVVLFRLLCPVSLSAPVSVLNAADVTVESVTRPAGAEAGAISTVTYVPGVTAEQAPAGAAPAAPVETEEGESLSVRTAASFVWLAGIVLLGLYSAHVYARLRRSLIGAIPLKDNIFLADHMESAFVLGILRPKIYLPSDTPMAERRYIIAYERHHIRRFDHIIKLLAYAALCLHWFNPLVWLAFFLAGKDMEMSCDEAVIKKLGEHIRADYSASLLRLATHKRILGTPLAFGEGDTKGRVMNLAKWKQPRVWVTVLCIVLCAVVLISCAVNPEQKDDAFAAGPADVGLGALNLTLPAGYSAHSWATGKLDFTQGEESIGGIYRYDAPDFALLPDGTEGDWNGRAWVQALGIPEEIAESESDIPVYSNIYHNEPEGADGYKLYGDLVAAYWPVETDQPGTVHYFFIDDEDVYDVWFDETKIELKEIARIMDTAWLSQPIPEGANVLGEGDLHLRNFHMRVPGGFFYYALVDGNLSFFDGYQDIGGLTVYPMPDYRVMEDPVSIQELEDHFFELQSIGLPETQEENTNYGAVTDSYGDLEARFWTDAESPETGTDHYLYYDYIGQQVYDLWFDLSKIEEMDTWDFLSSAYTMRPGATLMLEDFTVTLPEGMDWTRQGSNAYLFTVAGQEYGGVGKYPLREPLIENVDWFDWITANALPTRYEEGMWRSAGNDNYGEFYFRCGTEEGSEQQDYRHIFYTTDEQIYVLWFDWTLIRDNEYRAIMQNLYLDWEAPVETEPVAVSSREEALAKCRAVLDAVQTGSCHISLERSSKANSGIGDYTQEYLRHGEDWMSVVSVQIGETLDRHATLFVDGKRFSNQRNRSAEELIWEKSVGEGVLRPWLDSFDWDGQEVAYVSTLPEAGGEAVFLMVIAPYEYGEVDTPYMSYSVTFHFDRDGNFENVVVQADMSTEDETGQKRDYGVIRTERIVSLDGDAVMAQIEKEYISAIAE